MYTILFDRLIETGNISGEMEWVNSGKIDLEHIGMAMALGVTGDATPYGDVNNHPASVRDRAYHIARIIYFVQHPDEISGMEIDNACIDEYIFPIPTVVDGWHRIMAGMYLGLEKVRISYGGRMDLLRYLQGRRKSCPID